MAVNDFLSRDEINALLNSSTTDLVVTDGEKEPDSEQESSDKVQQNQSINEQFRMLDTVNERFSGFFQLALSNLLSCSTEIILDGVQGLKFSDYAHSLFIPTSMNKVRIKPLNETGLFVFDPKLVFMIVDKYFGGEGRPFNISEGREFAPTELRVISMILEKLLVTLQEAWSPITKLDPEFIISEANPQYTNVFEPNEIVIVNTFRISIDNVEGELHVTMPRSLLVALRDLSENST